MAAASYREQQRRVEKKRKSEQEYRRRLLAAITEKLPARLDRELLEVVAVAMFDRTWHESRKAFFTLVGWKPKETRAYSGDPQKLAFEEQVAGVTEAQLVQILLQVALIGETNVGSYAPKDDKPDAMLRVAKHLKVNPEPIRKQLAQEIKAKRKTKRGAKK